MISSNCVVALPTLLISRAFKFQNRRAPSQRQDSLDGWMLLVSQKIPSWIHGALCVTDCNMCLTLKRVAFGNLVPEQIQSLRRPQRTPVASSARKLRARGVPIFRCSQVIPASENAIVHQRARRTYSTVHYRVWISEARPCDTLFGPDLSDGSCKTVRKSAALLY